jgi:hypothetical protein
MAEERKVNIEVIAEATNSEYIMYLKSGKWGPIVSGSTLEETRDKMREALKFSVALLYVWTEVYAERETGESDSNSLHGMTDDLNSLYGRVENAVDNIGEPA